MDYLKEYRRWADSPLLDEEERASLAAIADKEEEIKSRFYAPLAFGTAGLRGVMDAGLARMNRHVIRQASQGMAELIKSAGGQKRGVVICYDCRENSEAFARTAAEVFCGNGIMVSLFDALRPTPELSFAIRELGAIAGVNVTASHNPREYNGYKVYWEDGAQLPPEHAALVAREMARIDVLGGAKSLPLDEAEQAGLLRYIGAEVDERFLACVLGEVTRPDCIPRADLRVVYTPFHGAGYKLVPEALRRLGLKRLSCVEAQMTPDGTFPTVKSPNPEEPAGFALALETAEAVSADLVVGTDPDSDRIACVVLDAGAYRHISGNQLGVLLLDYLIDARREAGRLPEACAALKSLVTTEMAKAVCAHGGVHMEDTFTGFKFMAEKIKQFETDGSYRVLMSFEESIGYMIGDFVRDKDAVTTAAVVVEMASWYALQGKTLIERLRELYAQYGHYVEKTVNLVMPGLDGLEKMQALMARLRENPPKTLGGVRVLRVRDYDSGTVSENGKPVGKTELCGSNVLYFELDGGSAFIVRPSGTEPKIKVYVLARGDSEAACTALAERCEADAKRFQA